MFRINLLPKEVLERRRFQGLYRWVAILAVALIISILLAWIGFAIEVQQKTNELQSVQELANNTNSQAAQLSVFENKESDLQKREVIAQTALAGRVNVGQVANDISLVLPDEVWVDLLTINQDTGIILSANTPRTAGESTDVAYKSVAKTLVRLNELPELYDVWLGTATNATWGQWAVNSSLQATPLAVHVVAFQASGKVVRPGAPGSSAGGSAGATHTVGAANAAQNAVNQANGAGSGGSQ